MVALQHGHFIGSYPKDERIELRHLLKERKIDCFSAEIQCLLFFERWANMLF